MALDGRLAKEESAKEIEQVIRNSKIKCRTYSTLGLRDDAEFLFWFASESIEEIQSVISKIYTTVFGKYIIPSHVYLSSTRPSIYAKTGRALAFVAGEEPKKYAIVYPFIKTRDWYLLPLEQRKKMMDDRHRRFHQLLRTLPECDARRRRGCLVTVHELATHPQSRARKNGQPIQAQEAACGGVKV